MGEIHPPQPVKLFCGILYQDCSVWEKASEILQERFGPLDYTSELFHFTETTYYNQEMGSDLIRLYVSFRDVVSPEILIEAKHFTNSVEKRFADAEGRRSINLDPGLLSNANLILASTKNYCHRVYLGKGIYAEVTMIYRQGRFQDLPWTYPDYRHHRDVFEEIRRIYRRQMKEG